MKIISGERASGKTTELLNAAVDDPKAVIVVRDHNRLTTLKNRVLEKFNKEINIITYPDFRNLYFGKGFCPSLGERSLRNFYIEDFDSIIDRAFPACNIKIVNLSSDEHFFPVWWSKMSSTALKDHEEYFDKALKKANEKAINYNGVLIAENSETAKKLRLLNERHEHLKASIYAYNNLKWYERLFKPVAF